MTAPPAVRDDVAGWDVVGLGWQPNGQAVLTGALARLAHACDSAFTVLAGHWNAVPEEHPAMIDVAALRAVDYLRSFPHLATFPVSLDPDESNVRDFADDPYHPSGAVRLTRAAPTRHVLTPAACYHVYPFHRGERLTTATVVTTRNTCFRRESHFQPLRRQWSFQMREIVCLGDRTEVTRFLDTARALVTALLDEIDLPVDWQVATDPFFDPTNNPKYLAQRLQPTKHEARSDVDATGDGVAIASVNLHEDFFGAAFDISRAGAPAVTGCVAFGIERWVYAVVRRFGTDPTRWPDLPAAARRVVGGRS